MGVAPQQCLHCNPPFVLYVRYPLFYMQRTDDLPPAIGNANKLLLFVIENNVSWKSFTRKHEFFNFLFEFNKTSRLSGNLESVI